MKKTIILGAFAILASVAAPASAQNVMEDPGWCAQFYPNANCQNYGRGNPYTSYGWARGNHWRHHHWQRQRYLHRY